MRSRTIERGRRFQESERFAHSARMSATGCSNWSNGLYWQLVDYLAYNATAGDLIPGTGGVRKLRWRLEANDEQGC